MGCVSVHALNQSYQPLCLAGQFHRLSECELSHSVSDASDLVELHLLCHPNSTFAAELRNKGERPTEWQLIEVTWRATCTGGLLTASKLSHQLHNKVQSLLSLPSPNIVMVIFISLRVSPLTCPLPLHPTGILYSSPTDCGATGL